MKIHILCNDGSPLGVTPQTIYGDGVQVGVGGAELALLTLSEAWKERGHDVVLYNDPRSPNKEVLDQRPISAFSSQEDRDILITFRSPNHRTYGAKGKRIWWSCDQNTVGDFRRFSKHNHQVVTISPRHKDYFSATYGINSTVIDIPVRTWEYQDQGVERIKNRLLFSSVPDRGLTLLARAYPAIKSAVPDVSLVITSDYRLWGSNMGAGTSQYVSQFLGKRDVIYRSAIPRRELIREQLQADCLSYPCTYDELFCIAVAEAQVAGAYPVTSGKGSLTTTNMGIVVPGSPDDYLRGWLSVFVQSVVGFLTKSETEKEKMRIDLMERSNLRFGLATILNQWDEVFNA